MKDDSLYIDHILQCINNIIEYTKDLSKQDFSKNKMVQDAVIRKTIKEDLPPLKKKLEDK